MLCNSCATKALWEATDPDRYVQIKYTDITEQELKSKGGKYVKDDNKKVYYVNKSSFEKLKNYTYRAIGTPVTIVVDATSLLIVGFGIGIANNFVEDHKVDPEADPYGSAEKNE